MHIEPVNPDKITQFKLNDFDLEHNLLFWIAVAGKPARTVAPRLALALRELWHEDAETPFDAIKKRREATIADCLKHNGIGCYTLRARGFKAAATSGLDLRTCSVDDLETIPGIRFKSSRCFVMHTRANARVAGLDTHILKFLDWRGYDVTKNTPSSKRVYQRLEQDFLNEADREGMTPTKFDHTIWMICSAEHKAPKGSKTLKDFREYICDR